MNDLMQRIYMLKNFTHRLSEKTVSSKALISRAL